MAHVVRMEVECRPLPSKRVGDAAKLLAALERLESLPVVNGQVRFDEKHNSGTGRLVGNIWCRQ